jgi:REP element-mobilizing transposase RayT
MSDARRGAMHRARRSLRLKRFDYSRPGAYFVTVCVQGRTCLFGEISGEKMRSNDAGALVRAVWKGLPQRFPNVALDEFVVMPNHVHGVVWIAPDSHVGAPFMAPSVMKGEMPGAMNRAPTLGQIVRAFKAVSTRQIRQSCNATFEWQRNYYEHIIRDERELNLIREYITNNPLQWEMDRENPRRPSIDARKEGAAEIFGGVLP